jgi:hypothetical protein
MDRPEGGGKVQGIDADDLPALEIEPNRSGAEVAP